MKIFLFLIYIFFATYLSAQTTSTEQDTLSARIAAQASLFPKEKIHLHIDRSAYMPGDTLWLKAYIVHALNHTPINISRYVYVELAGPTGETVERVKIRPDAHNLFHGYIPIPEEIPGGNYALLSYTRYMLAEEQQHIFKRGIHIAQINESKDTKKKAKHTTNNKNGKDHETTFHTLSQTQEQACGIHINDQQEKMQVVINRAKDMPQKDLFVVIHVRGNIIHAQWLPAGKKEIIEVDKSKYPPGVVQCLLLDKDYHVQSERLSFIPHRKAVVCHVKNDKSSYGKRERIQSTLSLTDANGNPIEGNLSIAITDHSIEVADTTNHILSTLLLSSELKEYIENPAFYLQKNNPEASKALDSLLMTQKWSRYRLPEIVKGSLVKPTMEPERFTSLSGRLKKKSGFNVYDKAEVSVRYLNGGFDKIIKTGNNGQFRVDSIEFADGMPIGIIGMRLPRIGENYGLNKTGVVIDEESFPIKDRRIQQALLPEEATKLPQELVYYAGLSHYYFKPITIKSPHIKTVLSQKEIAKLRFENVWQLMEHLGGKFSHPYIKTVPFDAGTFTAICRDKWMSRHKGLPLLIYMNNEYVSEQAGIFNYLSLSDISSLRLYYIDKNKDTGYGILPQVYSEYNKLPILKIYFYPGMEIDGLYQLSQIESKIKTYGKLDIQTDVYPSGGYQERTEFYSPQYGEGGDHDEFIPDFRSTLYWKADLQTDSLGKCGFSFYSADKVTTYKMVIEGMTKEGEMIYETREIKIK